MTALPHHQWTYDEYLEYESGSPNRYEYYGGSVFAMPWGTQAHSILSGNIYMSFRSQMRGRQCMAYQSDMQIGFAEEDSCFYPDVAAVCGQEQIEKRKGERLLNPMVIVEVLSRSTENFDKKGKFETYQLIPSITDYLLVRQDRVHVTHYRRQNVEDWPSAIYTSIEDEITLPSIGCVLRLEDVYDTITWDAPDQPQ